jgi:predicted RNA methylase
VNDDEKEHTDVVLEECAKNVCKDMFSNLRIQATNAYLKAHVSHPGSRKHRTEASIRVPRMFKSHTWQQYDKQMKCFK